MKGREFGRPPQPTTGATVLTNRSYFFFLAAGFFTAAFFAAFFFAAIATHLHSGFGVRRSGQLLVGCGLALEHSFTNLPSLRQAKVSFHRINFSGNFART